MKITRYFITTLLILWTGIILFFAFQSREKNKTYKKIKGWLEDGR